MADKENYTVEIKKYAIINGDVILFDVDLAHSGFFDGDEILSSAGLVCIWKKNNIRQVICCNEGLTFSVLSKPEIDQELIAAHMGITINSI